MEMQIIDIANHAVYKMSHGTGDIKEENLQLFLERQVIVLHKDTKAKALSKITQGEYFQKMAVGDYFYLCRGNQNLLLLGRITGEHLPCSVPELGADGWIERPYEVIALCQKDGKFNGDHHWWLPNDNSTFIQVDKNKLDKANDILFEPYFHCRLQAMDQETTSHDAPTTTTWQAKNTILYGPPGTGKTYNTINKALSLVDPDFLLVNRPRKEIVARFHELTAKGRILFTTFHQSMSYEEFVEGIKPNLGEESLQYCIEPGVFRRICSSAERNWIQSQGTTEQSFEDAFHALVRPLRDGEEFVKIPTPRGEYKIYEVTDRTIRFEKQNGSRLHSMSINTAARMYRDKQVPDTFGGLYTYYQGLLNALLSIKTNVANAPVPCDPYVLVIDEINRGNVSAIFGELITLLEDDKRMGEENELRIVLPYSKEFFAVPPNLYVIGTMNTADRSVEALDTALRRRFAFEEMTPQPLLLAQIDGETTNNGIDMQRMLSTINTRLEYLMGRDHTIGHAFFLSVTNLEDLQRVFQTKLIPQLQEYFYGDWSKVALVLGSAFVRDKQDEKPVFWPKGLEEPEDYRACWEITSPADWNEDSFRSIYGE